VTVDALVIGSGFGGAVVACRLAEAGYRVVVVERGRRWDPKTFPRAPGDRWLWDQDHPERANGWLDFRMFRRMAVAQGAAVGGGSLIYANISIEADRATLEAGWPPEITHQELFPHYQAVGEMLNVQPVPRGQWPARTALMAEAAAATGHADRFRPLELAVTFDPTWSPSDRTPATRRAARFVNRQGRSRARASISASATSAAGPRPQHARPHLPRPGRGPQRRRPPADDRADDRAADGGYRVHLERIDGGASRHDRDGARARRGRGLAGLDRAAAPIARRRPDAAPPAAHAGRALGANGDFLTIGWHPRATSDHRRPHDHERDRLPRRLLGRPPVPDRGRRLP
jgi:cholesterol oxidase